MADTVIKKERLIVKRFSCDCLFPGHILDVEIALDDENKVFLQCILNLYMDGKAPFKYRIKQIWKLLRGREGNLTDFILRPSDISEFVELLSKAVTSPYTSYTSGTTPCWY